MVCSEVSVRAVLGVVAAFVVVVSLVTGPDPAAALPVEVRSGFPGERIEFSSGDIESNVVTVATGLATG